MAYFPQHIQFINDCMTQNLGALEGKRMLELGNQDILNSFWGKSFAPKLSEKQGKEYYSRRESSIPRLISMGETALSK